MLTGFMFAIGRFLAAVLIIAIIVGGVMFYAWLQTRAEERREIRREKAAEARRLSQSNAKETT